MPNYNVAFNYYYYYNIGLMSAIFDLVEFKYEFDPNVRI